MNYKLITSFGIDDGELDGLKLEECFVLGYELALVNSALKNKHTLTMRVHPENQTRIHQACKTAKRKYQLKWMPQDSSESWMELLIL
jgi:hypothetical protein